MDEIIFIHQIIGFINWSYFFVHPFVHSVMQQASRRAAPKKGLYSFRLLLMGARHAYHRLRLSFSLKQSPCKAYPYRRSAGNVLRKTYNREIPTDSSRYKYMLL
jgi:hypothetical protein